MIGCCTLRLTEKCALCCGLSQAAPTVDTGGGPVGGLSVDGTFVYLSITIKDPNAFGLREFP